MTKPSSDPAQATPAKSKKEAARERSAAALRENLKRRKAQARGRPEEPDPADKEPPADP